MGVTHPVLLTKASKADFDGLDGSQKPQVLKSFAKLEENGMEAGAPLHGSLAGCRKLKHQRLGLRIVFRASAEPAGSIEVVAIGKRDGGDVYTVAGQRLVEDGSTEPA